MVKFMWTMLIAGIILFTVGSIGSGCSDTTTPTAVAQTEQVDKADWNPKKPYGLVNCMSIQHASTATPARNMAQSAIYTYELEVVAIVKDSYHWWTVFVKGDNDTVTAWQDHCRRSMGAVYR